jgi:hypothetical protein
MDPGCPHSQTGCGTPQTTRDDQLTTSPGELFVYTDVAGQWTMWPKPIPSRDGALFTVRHSTDVYVLPTQRWRVFVFPHECDFGVASWSDPSTPMAPCPTSKEFGNFGGDDIPGEIVVHYRGADAVGSHVLNGSLAPPSTCPAAKNPSGCWRVWWTVTRVRG